MQSETRIYSLPRWRVTRWLADCGPGVPDDIRVELIGNLFGNLPVFVGGVINTVAVAIAIVARKPTAPFIAWLVFEIAVCTARLIVLLVARRAALSRAETPTDIYLILGLAWSASVGYGVIVSLAGATGPRAARRERRAQADQDHRGGKARRAEIPKTDAVDHGSRRQASKRKIGPIHSHRPHVHTVQFGLVVWSWVAIPVAVAKS